MLPEFFIKHYAGNQLKDTIIILEECESAGAENIPHYELMNGFINCGAKGVTGYVNSVSGAYARDFSKELVINLRNGEAIINSFYLAKKKVGATDEMYCKQTNDEPKDGYYAYPVLLGDLSASVFKSLIIPTQTMMPSPTPFPIVTTMPTVTPTITGSAEPISSIRTMPVDVMFIIEGTTFTSISDVECAEEAYLYAYENRIDRDNIFFGRNLDAFPVVSNVNGYDYSSGERHNYSLKRIDELKNQVAHQYITDNDITCIDHYVFQVGNSIGNWVFGESTQPSYFHTKNLVFYITNEVGNYMSGDESILEYAQQYVEQYHIRVYVVNLSGYMISPELKSFVATTNGCELPNDPQVIWRTLTELN